jgi:hypothetical protein
MRNETWELLERQYRRFRTDRAEGVDGSEFDAKFVGLPVSADYREFVIRYGGALVGNYPIYGLRMAEDMGTVRGKRTAPEITQMFRDLKWQSVENWLVFSIDQSGQPIGMPADGSVLISDRGLGQVQQLADSFEDFLLKWGLRLVPIR